MTSSSPNLQSPAPFPDDLKLRAALDQSRALLGRMPQSDIVATAGLAIDDVPLVVSGYLERISEILPTIDAGALGASDIAARLDVTRNATYVAEQANRELALARAAHDVRALAAELREANKTLALDACSHARRERVDLALVPRPARPSHYEIAMATFALVHLLRDDWRVLDEWPCLTRDVERAEALAVRMFAAIAERDGRALEHRAADTRGRAISLLIREDDQIRRVVAFARWDEGDADEIAPSRWSGRARCAASAQRSTRSEPTIG